MRHLLLGLLTTVTLAQAQWNLALTESRASLRGVYNAGGGVIWASGANGTVLRSEDDGYMWQNCKVLPEMAKLDFRAVVAWDANHAQVMSSGTGSASRLYETADGGATWHLLFANPDPKGFWDALVFQGTHAYILGDPVDGRFVLYHSNDGGRHWQPDNSPELAAASEGEGAFAASNSSLAILSDGTIFIGTGGLGGARIFRRDKSGRWSAVRAPLTTHKESAGVFSLSFRDTTHGIAVGGDYEKSDDGTGAAASTSDGGLTWHAAQNPPSGYRSGVAWSQKVNGWIAIGANGSDISRDDGRTWKRLDAGNWNALSLPWAVGPNGRIGSLDIASPPVR
ncbi:MAG TPA: hypothetical protein VH302_11235 [Bryobacteraceae bacterium]|nr:hypothetical protein [Bryobacteraceae bacterium]